MQKGLISLTALTAMLTQGPLAFAATDDNPLCTAREAEVSQQIDAARQRGNQNQLRGLEKALDNIQRHCTDKALLAEAEDEVRESLRHQEEQRQELEEAIQAGDAEDIRDRRQDLQEATAELEEHIQELEELRDRHRNN